MALQPPRQLHTSEVRHADRRARKRRNQTVHQRTERQMPSHTRPTRRKLRIRIPPHTELQRQRITNHNPRRRIPRNRIGRRSRNSPRRHTLRRSMHQHIQTTTHMQMAQLQRPRQRNNHWRINLTQTALSIRHIRRPLLKLFLQRARRQGFGRDAAGKGSIVVDVEFEQVEERVVDEVEGAVDFLFDAEEEFERAAGFVAGEEGDVGELTLGVGYVFACVAVPLLARRLDHWMYGSRHASFCSDSSRGSCRRLCSLHACQSAVPEQRQHW